jgi:hypothetical protein
MGMSETMETMRIQLRWKKHRKLMMDRRRLWRTEHVILQIVKIGQYISDM